MQSRGDSSKDAENKTQTIDYSQVFPYFEFFCLVLDLLGTSGLIFPSNSSKQKCLSYPYLTIVFWKLVVCFLASQVHRWREILTSNLTCPKSHPYLIYMMVLGTLCVNKVFFFFLVRIYKINELYRKGHIFDKNKIPLKSENEGMEAQ